MSQILTNLSLGYGTAYKQTQRAFVIIVLKAPEVA